MVVVHHTSRSIRVDAVGLTVDDKERSMGESEGFKGGTARATLDAVRDPNEREPEKGNYTERQQEDRKRGLKKRETIRKSDFRGKQTLMADKRAVHEIMRGATKSDLSKPHSELCLQLAEFRLVRLDRDSPMRVGSSREEILLFRKSRKHLVDHITKAKAVQSQAQLQAQHASNSPEPASSRSRSNDNTPARPTPSDPCLQPPSQSPSSNTISELLPNFILSYRETGSAKWKRLTSSRSANDSESHSNSTHFSESDKGSSHSLNPIEVPLKSELVHQLPTEVQSRILFFRFGLHFDQSLMPKCIVETDENSTTTIGCSSTPCSHLQGAKGLGASIMRGCEAVCRFSLTILNVANGTFSRQIQVNLIHNEQSSTLNSSDISCSKRISRSHSTPITKMSFRESISSLSGSSNWRGRFIDEYGTEMMCVQELLLDSKGYTRSPSGQHDPQTVHEEFKRNREVIADACDSRLDPTSARGRELRLQARDLQFGLPLPFELFHLLGQALGILLVAHAGNDDDEVSILLLGASSSRASRALNFSLSFEGDLGHVKFMHNSENIPDFSHNSQVDFRAGDGQSIDLVLFSSLSRSLGLPLNLRLGSERASSKRRKVEAKVGTRLEGRDNRSSYREEVREDDEDEDDREDNGEDYEEDDDDREDDREDDGEDYDEDDEEEDDEEDDGFNAEDGNDPDGFGEGDLSVENDEMRSEIDPDLFGHPDGITKTKVPVVGPIKALERVDIRKALVYPKRFLVGDDHDIVRAVIGTTGCTVEELFRVEELIKRILARSDWDRNTKIEKMILVYESIKMSNGEKLDVKQPGYHVYKRFVRFPIHHFSGVLETKFHPKAACTREAAEALKEALRDLMLLGFLFGLLVYVGMTGRGAWVRKLEDDKFKGKLMDANTDNNKLRLVQLIQKYALIRDDYEVKEVVILEIDPQKCLEIGIPPDVAQASLENIIFHSSNEVKLNSVEPTGVPVLNAGLSLKVEKETLEFIISIGSIPPVNFSKPEDEEINFSLFTSAPYNPKTWIENRIMALEIRFGVIMRLDRMTIGMEGEAFRRPTKSKSSIPKVEDFSRMMDKKLENSDTGLSILVEDAFGMQMLLGYVKKAAKLPKNRVQLLCLNDDLTITKLEFPQNGQLANLRCTWFQISIQNLEDGEEKKILVVRSPGGGGVYALTFREGMDGKQFTDMLRAFNLLADLSAGFLLSMLYRRIDFNHLIGLPNSDQEMFKTFLKLKSQCNEVIFRAYPSYMDLTSVRAARERKKGIGSLRLGFQFHCKHLPFHLEWYLNEKTFKTSGHDLKKGDLYKAEVTVDLDGRKVELSVGQDGEKKFSESLGFEEFIIKFGSIGLVFLFSHLRSDKRGRETFHYLTNWAKNVPSVGLTGLVVQDRFKSKARETQYVFWRPKDNIDSAFKGRSQIYDLPSPTKKTRRESSLQIPTGLFKFLPPKFDSRSTANLALARPFMAMGGLCFRFDRQQFSESREVISKETLGAFKEGNVAQDGCLSYFLTRALFQVQRDQLSELGQMNTLGYLDRYPKRWHWVENASIDEVLGEEPGSGYYLDKDGLDRLVERLRELSTESARTKSASIRTSLGDKYRLLLLKVNKYALEQVREGIQSRKDSWGNKEDLLSSSPGKLAHLEGIEEALEGMDLDPL